MFNVDISRLSAMLACATSAGSDAQPAICVQSASQQLADYLYGCFRFKSGAAQFSDIRVFATSPDTPKRTRLALLGFAGDRLHSTEGSVPIDSLDNTPWANRFLGDLGVSVPTEGSVSVDPSISDRLFFDGDGETSSTVGFGAQLPGEQLFLVLACSSTPVSLPMATALRTLGLAELHRGYQAREQLRALAQQEQLMNHLAHDLKTPMVAASRVLEYLVERPNDPNIKELLLKLYANSVTTLHMVSNVLESLKTPAETAIINDTCDLGRVVSDTMEQIALLAQDKKLSVNVKLPETVVRVRGDYAALQRIVLNLIINAIKYTPAGGSVIVELALKNGTAEIKVTDTGVGISEAAQPFVFEKFKTAGKYREIGTGLGLHLSRKCAEEHNGSLNFTSKEGAGSTFVFCLPLA